MTVRNPQLDRGSKKVALGTSADSLQDSTVIVADAGGELSYGIASACLGVGARVVVPSRCDAQSNAFRNRIEPSEEDRLETILVDPLDPKAVEEFCDDLLDRYGQIDMVIASIGEWRTAGRRVDSVPPQTFQRQLENILAHYNLARALVPVLDGAGRGTYVFINRHLADYTVKLSGPTHMACSAQRALMKTYATEFDDENSESVRIVEICAITNDTSYIGASTEVTDLAYDVGQVAVAAAEEPHIHGEIIRL
jgi:3-oxoacyl-[acyl-carrier protein] reductase